jgi:hypothetical protein
MDKELPKITDPEILMAVAAMLGYSHSGFSETVSPEQRHPVRDHPSASLPENPTLPLDGGWERL